jgi:DNA-binding transcriptional ArsR family regulator
MASTSGESPSPESDSQADGLLPPDEAFAALGNETRIAILLTLEGCGDALSYSELMRQVGVYDSGRFNYHLNKLLGHFIDGSNDGYRLRDVGVRAARAVEAETFAPRRQSIR